MSETKHRVGAPKGNHNALKHGFYSARYAPASLPDQEDQEDPGTLDLTDEIALLRLSIARVVELTPPDQDLDSARETLRLLCLASTAISRLVRAHHFVHGDQDQESLRDEMGRIADEVRLELEARARQDAPFFHDPFPVHDPDHDSGLASNTETGSAPDPCSLPTTSPPTPPSPDLVRVGHQAGCRVQGEQESDTSEAECRQRMAISPSPEPISIRDNEFTNPWRTRGHANPGHWSDFNP